MDTTKVPFFNQVYVDYMREEYAKKLVRENKSNISGLIKNRISIDFVIKSINGDKLLAKLHIGPAYQEYIYNLLIKKRELNNKRERLLSYFQRQFLYQKKSLPQNQDGIIIFDISVNKNNFYYDSYGSTELMNAMSIADEEYFLETKKEIVADIKAQYINFPSYLSDLKYYNVTFHYRYFYPDCKTLAREIIISSKNDF